MNSPPTLIPQFSRVKQMFALLPHCFIFILFLTAPTFGSLGNSNKRSNAILSAAHKSQTAANN